MKHFFTLFIGIALLTTANAQQPGTIDKSYGASGAAITSGNGTLIFSSAIQPDDKVIAGGEDSSNQRFVLERYNKNGSIDLTFGDKGKVVTSVDLSVYIFGVGNGWTNIATQPDGKIIAAGIGDKLNKNGGTDFFSTDILIARYLPNGELDESFGLLGKVILDLGGSETVNAITVQKDGKLVIAGNGSSKLLLARFNTNGSLDASFGNGLGYVENPSINASAYSVALQPDGKILAGGSSHSNMNLLLTRYLANGTLDQEFGDGGTIITSVGFYFLGMYINSLAVDETGKIIASGNTQDNEGNNQIAVLRYLPNGTLDNSFDADGKKTIVFGGINGYSTKLLLPNQDKIIVTGYAYTDHPNADFALAFLNANGSFDSTFGTNGKTTADFGHDETTCGALLQSDGKIILAASDLNDLDFVNTLSRYYDYPVKVSLIVRIKRWLQNHTLNWKGLPAEDQIAYYTVEQSPNDTSGFTQVAKVSGVANLKDYSLTNSRLLQGSNYYRIKAVSTDGVIRYSEVVSADNTANTASVFPNPAKSYVTVQGLPNNETANISITDGSGNVLARVVSTGSGQYRSQLGANMQAGTYYVNITTGSKTEVLKFVKE